MWGKSEDPKATVPLKEGEEECVICFDAPTQIKFRPCKHGACHVCVGKLRAANIFKARAPSALRQAPGLALRPLALFHGSPSAGAMPVLLSQCKRCVLPYSIPLLQWVSAEHLLRLM